MINRTEIPTTLNLDGREITFAATHQLYAETVYGHILATKTRYDRYNLAKLSDDDWKFLLGADVDNLKHMPLTYGIARSFFRHSDTKYSQEKKENTLFGTMHHDDGEAVISDITYEKKSDKNEEDEELVLQQISQEIFGSVPGLSDRFDSIVKDIIRNPKSEMGQVFNAIERLGYLRTGIRAWQISSSSEGLQKDGLYWLSNNVLLNQIPTLIEYSKIYRPVRLYLINQRRWITNAFENLPESAFDNYSDIEIDKRKKMYSEAKEKWGKYRSKMWTYDLQDFSKKTFKKIARAFVS